MQSHNQPLHTLLGQRQYWAPLLAPSLHREQSTCQDVDCYSQATPREDDNSAALAFRCYFMTYIHRLSVCKRSEQRQSVDWESWRPSVRGAVQLKSLFFFWITEVWLIEIAFFPLSPRRHGEFKAPTNCWREVQVWKAVAEVLKQCACHADVVPQNQRANAVQSLHCTCTKMRN